MAIHNFVKVGFLHKIERLEYPRFTALIDLTKAIPVFENLEFQDMCSATETLQAINEASEFIEEILKNL